MNSVNVCIEVQEGEYMTNVQYFGTHWIG